MINYSVLFVGLLCLWILTCCLLVLRIDKCIEQKEYIKWLEGELIGE